MAKTLAEISTTELEQLVERTIDKRLEVWLAQLADALTGVSEDEMPLRPDFAASLRRSLEQARAGEGIDLKTFREQLTR
jgi:hypothetical protein